MDQEFVPVRINARDASVVALVVQIGRGHDSGQIL
jgi:hypothetical protein